jgi:hypothetical protein
MESIPAIQAADSVLQGLVGLTGALIGITQFLFLTAWGWMILVLVFILTVVSRSRDPAGEISLSGVFRGLGETAFWFYSNMVSIVIGIVLVLLLSFVYNGVKELSVSLSLYRDIKMLESALHNLKAERKLLEVSAVPFVDADTRKIKVRVKYFSYSPVKNADLPSGEAEYVIAGRKLYIDFGLLNFDYALIEKGTAVNIAYPNRIFSESVAPTNGTSIIAVQDGLPLSFKLDERDLYLLGIGDFKNEIGLLFSAATNDALARKMGIRSFYGEALGMTPDPERIYRIYSTGTGGVLLK